MTVEGEGRLRYTFKAESMRELPCSKVLNEFLYIKFFLPSQVISKRVSKGNPELLRVCFTSVPDWLIKSRHPLTNEIQKPTASWSLTFSRVLWSLLVLTVSSHWLFLILYFDLIGQWGWG